VILVLSHVNQQPMSIMEKAGFADLIGRENFAGSIDDALMRASGL